MTNELQHHRRCRLFSFPSHRRFLCPFRVHWDYQVPIPLARVHAITKPQTVGLILTIIGAIIRVLGTDSPTGDLGVLVLLVLFALITSPVTGQRVGRIARREGLYDDTCTVHRDKVRDGK